MGCAYGSSVKASTKHNTSITLRWMPAGIYRLRLEWRRGKQNAAILAWLFRLGDYPARDTWRRGAGCAGCDRVDDHRGAAVTEDGVIVGTHGDIRRDHRGMRGAVGGHNQRKIRNVSGREPAVIGMVSVSCPVWVEMRSRGLEV